MTTHRSAAALASIKSVPDIPPVASTEIPSVPSADASLPLLDLPFWDGPSLAELEPPPAPRWAVSQTCCLTNGTPAMFEGKAQLLDHRDFPSVSLAVEHLNQTGEVVCPEGICGVFSKSQGEYFVLFREDKKAEAFVRFGFVDATPASKPRNLFRGISRILDFLWAAQPPKRFDHKNLVGVYSGPLGDKYEVERQLATGAQGTTYLLRRKDNSDLYVAKETHDAAEDGIKTFMEEFETMRNIRHPNCAKVVELVRNQVFASGALREQIFIISEYAPGRDLYRYMHTAVENDGLIEEVVANIFCQAMEGVAYLHACGMVYNDLKPENILVMGEFEPGKPPYVVVADYGCARLASDRRFIFGDPRYQAPESVRAMEKFMKDDVVPRMDGPKVDVWAMGVTLFELLSGGVLPFLYERCTVEQVLHEEKLTRLIASVTGEDVVQVDEHCRCASDEAKDLLHRLLRKDPCERPTATEVLSHQWFFIQSRGRTVSEEISRNIDLRAAKTHAHQILLNLLAAKLQHQHVEKCHRVFREFDRSREGVIDKVEFREALWKHFGRDAAEADRIFKGGDVDSSGKLEFNEFVALTMDWGSLEPKTLDKYLEMLRQDLNANGSGVHEKDLGKLFDGVLGKKDLRDVFRQIDKDGDGTLSIEDLRQFLIQDARGVA